MKKSLIYRTWISPIIFITFLVVGVTGVFLAFHKRSTGILNLHEWVGYVFMAFSVLHLLVNAKMFMALFRKKTASIATCIALLLSAGVYYFEDIQTKLAPPPAPSEQAAAKPQVRTHPLIRIFDMNHDGIIDAAEIANAGQKLSSFDANHDGQISLGDFMRHR